MKLAFLFGSIPTGGRPLDLRVADSSPRGLTGTDNSFVGYARTMASRGHEVHAFVKEHEFCKVDGIQVWPGVFMRSAADTFDAVLSWCDPDLLDGVPDTCVRLVNCQLNNFDWVRTNHEASVDVYTAPSKTLAKRLAALGRAEDRWRVLPNGCDPEIYDLSKKVPGRCIYTSSPDRGLHIALEMWPEIRKVVPEAELWVYYHSIQHFIDSMQENLDNPHWIPQEQGRRAKVVRDLIDQPGVKRIGSVSRQEMAKAYSEAMVLAYPCDTITFCVTGDTLIDTDSGLRRLDELATFAGRAVAASTDGSYNKISKWMHSGRRSVTSVTTYHGFSVTGTGNHPLLVLNEQLELVWTPIDQVRIGDHVCVNRRANRFAEAEPDLSNFTYKKPARGPMPEPKRVPTRMSPALALVLGYLVAEGTIGTTKIEFVNKDPEVLDDYRSAFYECFPDTRLHEFTDRGCTKLELHSRYVIKFLHACGLVPIRSAEKRVPWSILRAREESVCAFVSAYLEGDGGMVGVGSVAVHSISPALLRDVQLLLLKLGVTSAIDKRGSEYTTTLGRTETKRSLYVRERASRAALQLKAPFRSSRKRAAAAEPHEADGPSRPRLDRVPHAKEAIMKLLQDRRLPDTGTRLAPHGRPRGRCSNDDGTPVEASPNALGMRESGGSNTRTWLRHAAESIRYVSEKLATRVVELCDGPYLFDPVLAKESAGEADVYDLTIDGTHAFTGNGIMCHNTEGFGVAVLEGCASGAVPVISHEDAFASLYLGACPMVRSPAWEHREQWAKLVVQVLTDFEWRGHWVGQGMALAEKHSWHVLGFTLEQIIMEAKARKI